MNELALFAGTGGGILGGKLLGWRTVAAVEKEPYCREVLLRRQRDGVLPMFPIWDDVRTFDGTKWSGKVDIVTAGFPCQPFSIAGKQNGKDDERNMWPETIRIIREVGPRFAFLENVPGLVRHDYFGEILGDLAEAGFNAEWEVISAAEVGACHIRKRLWMLAYSNCTDSGRLRVGAESENTVPGVFSQDNSNTNSNGFSGKSQQDSEQETGSEVQQWYDLDGLCDNVSNSNGSGLSEQRRAITGQQEFTSIKFNRWREVESGLDRVVDAMVYRVDRLRAIGNGQVPGVVVAAWNELIKRV